ncbi:B12-binding domain-containing radical SAM protein, partial [bacterium]
AEALARGAPDVVGLSVYLWNLGAMRRLAAELKARLPEAKVVLGGAEPSSRPAEVLSSVPAADWAVFGEGEEAFGELLEALLDGKSPEGLPGLAWRGADGVVVGPARPAAADLDARPSPWAAGVLPHTAYPAVCFEASRGCPFDCKYCDWQNKSRVRRYSEERAAADMRRLLAALPGARVFVCDSDLFLDARRGERLARAWGQAAAGNPCTFEVHAYLPRLDDAALRALDAPQFTVCVGVQTANPRALDRVSRFFDAEKTRERAAAFRRLAPRARLNLQLIYGLPGDDPAGFRASLDYALALEPDSVMTFPALALPGSELGRDPAAFGLRRQEEPPYRVLETEGFTPQDLADADFLAFHLFTLQRHRAASRVLRWLGRLVGHARAYESFARRLAGTPFDLRPVYEAARRDLLGFVTHSGEPWGGLASELREAGLLTLLAGFARAELAAAGVPERWPELAEFLAAERRAALWREVASAASFHRALEGALGAGTADSLWWGTEAAAAAEAPLGRGGRRVHWLPPGPRPSDPCREARHISASDLAADAAAALGPEPFGRAALSMVCRWLPAGARREVWSGLRRRARRGARLAVLDDFAAPGTLEADGVAAESADAAQVAEELATAGWRPVRAPAPLAGGAFTMLLAEADA